MAVNEEMQKFGGGISGNDISINGNLYNSICLIPAHWLELPPPPLTLQFKAIYWNILAFSGSISRFS